MRSKKAQITILIILLLVILATLSLFYLMLLNIRSNQAFEEVSISLDDGVSYSSKLQTDNYSIFKFWVISGSILKILIGIATIIIAIAILKKITNLKPQHS